MSQTGGRKRQRADDGGLAPTAKVHKGTMIDLFNDYPVDTTTEQSKYEEYTQNAATVDPLEITVTKTRSWIDMPATYFEYEVEFVANDNATLLTDAALAYPINNIGHALIKQMDVYVNKTLVGEASEHYHLTAYMDRLINHSDEEKNTWLALEGWYTDTAGKFDLISPKDATLVGPGTLTADAAGGTLVLAAMNAMLNRVTANEGAKKRHKLCCSNRRVKFIIAPRIPFLRCGRYLPPGVQIDFRIKWNSPELVFMAFPNVAITADQVTAAQTIVTAGNGHTMAAAPHAAVSNDSIVACGVQAAHAAHAPKFKIVPYSPKIWIRHVEANSELHLKNETEMLTNQRIAIFPFSANRVVTHTFTDGRRKGHVHNLFQGKRPNYLILLFQEGNAYNGAYDKNPYNFKDMHQGAVRVTIDGNELPFARIHLDSLHKEEGYSTLINFSGRGYDSAAIGISRESYKDGNYMLVYNLNPDGEQNESYNYDRNVGNVNVDVDFSEDTALNTTLIAYGEFEQAVWIDGHKNVSLRTNY